MSTPTIDYVPGDVNFADDRNADNAELRIVMREAFGDGSDGALTVTTGTTNIDAAGARVVVKQYSSVSITGGTVALINPHDEGTVLIILCQGNYTNTTPGGLTLASCGAIGGVGVTLTKVGDVNGFTLGNGGTINWNARGGLRAGGAGQAILATGSAVRASGGGGAASMPTDGTAAGTVGTATGGIAGVKLALNELARGLHGIPVEPGNGGGSGGVSAHGIGGSVTATSKDAGRGGGGLWIRVGGNWNFTGTINLSGSSPANATCSGTGSGGGAAGGSSGGSGGYGLVQVKGTLTADSGTKTVTAGTPSSAAVYSGLGSDGGASAAGAIHVERVY
jgi:hypothetical protein